MVNTKSFDSVASYLAGDPQENETRLLLAMLDLALTNIEIAATNQDEAAAARCLMRAVETYGSVKSILPKVGLKSEQIELVQERLDVVRRRLWTGPMRSGVKA
jgi:hypothetical protein